MLDKFLKTAIEMNADSAEFEYEGNELGVTAFRGPTGLGIGSVESNTKECKQLLDEIRVLRRRKTVKVGESVYRVSVSEYDSFGETAYRIKLTTPKSD